MRWIRPPPTGTDAHCAAPAPDVRPALGPRGKTWFACSWAPFSQELEPPLNPGRFNLTNRESFASDEEALELWDSVVGSLRLRPGAV
ncbi:T6SS immunity protein Tli4 family protein [Cupriavidus sp. CP313]